MAGSMDSIEEGLAGKVAIVTGAGSRPGEGVGNGRAAAILLARAGAGAGAGDDGDLAGQAFLDAVHCRFPRLVRGDAGTRGASPQSAIRKASAVTAIASGTSCPPSNSRTISG